MDLKQLREVNDLTQRELSEKTGIPRPRIAKWEQGKGKPKKDDADILVKFFGEVSPKIELEIENAADSYVEERRNVKINQAEKVGIPFYDVDFSAGTGIDFYDDIKTEIPLYKIDMPEFNGCTAFRAMLFATKETHWKEYLEYGQIYGVVCTNGRRFLKYIRKSQDPKTAFRMVSENKEYDPFDLPIKTIKSIWLIHGWVNKRT